MLALIGAACGDDDDGGGAADTASAATTSATGESVAAASTAPAVEDDVDPEGVLRIAATLEANGVPAQFDPATSGLISDLGWMTLVFGTLLRENTEGVLEPWMAESYEIVDPQTMKLTLREGVTFTDGAAYDAEAVRTSLLRTRDQATPTAQAGRHTGYRILGDVTVDGPLELTITLTEPAAGEFAQALASREGAVVSPNQADLPLGAIDENPIGAGPYMLENRTTQVMSLRKNPDFFDADSWRLGGIDYVHSPTGPAAVTGLFAGSVDMAGIPDTDIERVEAEDKYETYSRSTDYGYIYLQMCLGKPPFDDVKVRQAVQVTIDREAISQLVYGGRARPAYGLWPEDHAYFNPATKEVALADPEEGKRLLAEAGVTEIETDLWLVAGTGYERVAQVLQAQLEEIGINLNIISTPNIVSEFIEPQKPGMMAIPGSRTRVDKYGRVFAPGAVQALCGVNRPDIMDIVTPTAALQPSDPAVARAYQEAERLVMENANPIPVVYVPNHTAWVKDKIGGEPKFSPTNGALRLDSIYIRKS